MCNAETRTAENGRLGRKIVSPAERFELVINDGVPGVRVDAYSGNFQTENAPDEKAGDPKAVCSLPSNSG